MFRPPVHRASSLDSPLVFILPVTSIRDPKGNLTSITYDAKGNPLTITDALNQVTTFTYNPKGLLLTTKKQRGSGLAIIHAIFTRTRSSIRHGASAVSQRLIPSAKPIDSVMEYHSGSRNVHDCKTLYL